LYHRGMLPVEDVLGAWYIARTRARNRSARYDNP
jgi:hypothetical protein